MMINLRFSAKKSSVRTHTVSMMLSMTKKTHANKLRWDCNTGLDTFLMYFALREIMTMDITNGKQLLTNFPRKKPVVIMYEMRNTVTK